MDRIPSRKTGQTEAQGLLPSGTRTESESPSRYHPTSPSSSARATSGFFSGLGSAIKQLFERQPGTVMQEKTATLDGEMRNLLEQLGNGRAEDGNWKRLARASTDLLRSAERSGVGNMEGGAILTRQRDQIVHAFKRQLPLPSDPPAIAIQKLAYVLKALSAEQARSLVKTGSSPNSALIDDMMDAALEETDRQIARLDQLDLHSVDALKQCREALLTLDQPDSAGKMLQAMLRLAAGPVLIGLANDLFGDPVNALVKLLRDGLVFDRADLAIALEPMLKENDGAAFLEKIVNLWAAKSNLVHVAKYTPKDASASAQTAQDFVQTVLDVVGLSYLDKFGIDPILSNMDTENYESLRWRADVLHSSPVFSEALKGYEDAIGILLAGRAEKHLGALIEKWNDADRRDFNEALFQLTFACDCASDISVGKASLLEQAFGQIMTAQTPVERRDMMNKLETPLPSGTMPAKFLEQKDLLQGAQGAYARYRTGLDPMY